MKRFINKLMDLKIRQKMIILYTLGGIIPLIFACVYINNHTQSLILNANSHARSQGISIISSLISENTTVMTNVVRSISYDSKIKKVAVKDYNNNSDKFIKDCKKIEIIGNMRNYYKQSVSDVTIYLLNNTIPEEAYDSIDNIKYVDNTVENEKWYKKAIVAKDIENWFYGIDNQGRRAIQVSRAIYDEKYNIIGVSLVTMEGNHLRSILEESDMETMVLFNRTVLYSNFTNDGRYDFLLYYFDSESRELEFKKVSHGINEYQLFTKRIDVSKYSNVYSLIGVENYNDILSDSFRMGFFMVVPIVIGVLFSTILIMVFADLFDKRTNMLLNQLKIIAHGDYDNLTPLGGNDEMSKIYSEVENMANDLKELNKQIVHEQVQKEKIHTKQKEVEFKMLASQINPHFLYNTLETIRMKAVVNKEPEIEELVKMLAKIMRYNIQVSDSLVSLESELNITEYYLKIQSYRFSDRISSDVMVDPDVDLQTLTMPLILQPFVENAYVHGLEEKDSDGQLLIHVFNSENQSICIEIYDNGKGMTSLELAMLRNHMNRLDKVDDENEDDAEETSVITTSNILDDESTHVGVVNVNQRIKMMYGDPYGVTVESRKNYFTRVTVKIPYITNGSEK